MSKKHWKWPCSWLRSYAGVYDNCQLRQTPGNTSFFNLSTIFYVHSLWKIYFECSRRGFRGPCDNRLDKRLVSCRSPSKGLSTHSFKVCQRPLTSVDRRRETSIVRMGLRPRITSIMNGLDRWPSRRPRSPDKQGRILVLATSSARLEAVEYFQTFLLIQFEQK